MGVVGQGAGVRGRFWTAVLPPASDDRTDKSAPPSGEVSEKLMGVIHLGVERGVDEDHVRHRVKDVLKAKGMDGVIVQVEKVTNVEDVGYRGRVDKGKRVGDCWCGVSGAGREGGMVPATPGLPLGGSVSGWGSFSAGSGQVLGGAGVNGSGGQGGIGEGRKDD